MTNYRQVGEKLGAFISANNPTTLQIQGLLADLLAGDELLLTMREVVSMPEFAALEGLAGGGSGSMQSDALLQSLAARYLPALVDGIGQLLDGMLDQPANQKAYPYSPPSTDSEPQDDPEKECRHTEPLQDLAEKYDQVLSGLNEINSAIKRERSTQEAKAAHQSQRQEPQKEEEASGCLVGCTIWVIITIVAALIWNLSPSKTSIPTDKINEEQATIEQPKAPDCDSELDRLEAANVQDAIRIYDKTKGDCMGSIFKKKASTIIFNKTTTYEANINSDRNLALGYYLKALDISEPRPGDTIEYYIGNTLVALKRYREAISYLDSYISKNPKDPYGFSLRGDAYAWLENWGQSCADNKTSRDLGKKTVILEDRTIPIEEYISMICS